MVMLELLSCHTTGYIDCMHVYLNIHFKTEKVININSGSLIFEQVNAHWIRRFQRDFKEKRYLEISLNSNEIRNKKKIVWFDRPAIKIPNVHILMFWGIIFVSIDPMLFRGFPSLVFIDVSRCR